MVKKFLSLINKETTTLHAGAYLLAFFALLSQVLAFLRDRLLAHLFGASTTLDIYYAAFRIPDFIFVTVASVVSLSVLVPFIVERENEAKEAVREFIDNIFTFFSVLVLLSAALAFFLIPHIVPILFEGFSAAEQAQIVLISRMLLFSPIALGFSNLFGSITQAYGRFAVYAMAPLLYNVGIIIGIIALGESLGALGVAIGVMAGATLHMLVQVPFTIKTGLFPRLVKRFNFGLIRSVAILSVPRTLTLSANHIALLFLVAIASRMSAGSISIFSFALNIQSVPMAIVGISYSLAAFPTMTRYFVEKNMEGFVDQVATTARHIIFWSLPLSALFIVLRAQVVRVLLGTGHFDWEDTRLTAAALALFVVSSVFQSLLLLFMRAFYSVGQTKKPFVISFASMAVLALSTWGLVRLFYESDQFSDMVEFLLRVDGLSGTAVLMLPLGFSIGMAVNSILLWAAFEREFKGFSSKLWRTVIESLTGALAMGAASYAGLAFLVSVFDTSSLLGIFLQGLIAGLLGIAAGVFLLYLLGSKELREVWGSLRGRFWKTRVIATDPEIV